MSDEKIDHATAADIMSSPPIILPTTTRFQDLVNEMCKKKISAIFIHDKTTSNYYIISQTDCVEFLDAGGLKDPLIAEVPASRIMKGPVELIDSDTTIDIVIRFMAERKYKRVLIASNGEPVGVISTRDILTWTDLYFRPAKAQILIFMDNASSIIIAKYVFTQNINKKIDKDLIDLFGGALSSISSITDEVMQKAGKMRRLVKENHTILFEGHNEITGILVCDHNSIELIHRLHDATMKFYEIHGELIRSNAFRSGLRGDLDLDQILPIFQSPPLSIAKFLIPEKRT